MKRVGRMMSVPRPAATGRHPGWPRPTQIAKIVGFTDGSEGIFVLRLDDLNLADDVFASGGSGSSSAALGPAESKAANDKQEATANARETIEESLRIQSRRIDAIVLEPTET